MAFLQLEWLDPVVIQTELGYPNAPENYNNFLNMSFSFEEEKIFGIFSQRIFFLNCLMLLKKWLKSLKWLKAKNG